MVTLCNAYLKFQSTFVSDELWSKGWQWYEVIVSSAINIVYRGLLTECYECAVTHICSTFCLYEINNGLSTPDYKLLHRCPGFSEELNVPEVEPPTPKYHLFATVTYFRSILLPCYNLWCHPVRCSYHSGAFRLLWCYLCTETKIGYRKKKKKTRN